MKRLIFIALLILSVLACKNSGNKAEESSIVIPAAEDLITFKYKLDGLQDSIIQDSIWKMIFVIEGVDQILISNEDSMVTFRVDKNAVKEDLIVKEIQNRGGTILEKLN